MNCAFSLSFLFIFLISVIFLSFQVFSQLDLTPLKAIVVIQCCSHRINRKITPEEIQSGILKTLLRPEDYLPLKDVSISKICYLGAASFFPGSLSPVGFSSILSESLADLTSLSHIKTVFSTTINAKYSNLRGFECER